MNKTQTDPQIRYKGTCTCKCPTLSRSTIILNNLQDIALYFIAIVAPFVIQPVINLLTIRSWWDFHSGTLGLILGLAITGAITQFTKITVGRPRPGGSLCLNVSFGHPLIIASEDLISRCIPVNGSADPTYGLSSVAICTQTDVLKLRDGFRSFPSGHSSCGFSLIDCDNSEH